MYNLRFAVFAMACCISSNAYCQSPTLAGNNAFTGNNTFPNINNVIFLDGVVYACSGTGLNAAEAALVALGAPKQGGTIDARSCQNATFNIAATVSLSVPTTLILGNATWSCNSGIGTHPCFSITAPSHIIMQQSSPPAGTGGFVPAQGTVLLAGTGWSGQYFFTVSTTSVTSFGTAPGTIIEGGSLDGNLQAASGIQVIDTFGVHIRDVSISNPNIGINIQGNNGGFSEGSFIDNVFITNPANYGILLSGDVSGISAANAHWGRIYVSLFTAGSEAIVTDSNALFKNSHVDYVKVWMSNCGVTSPITETALTVAADMDGTIFDSFNVEVLQGTAPCNKSVSARGIFVNPTTKNQPAILSYVTQGASTVANQVGVQLATSSSRQLQAYLGAISIGGGSTVNSIYRASGLSLNSAFGSITVGTCQEQNLTLTGVATTGVASVQPTATPGANFSWSARVSSANTISVRLCNLGATATPSSVTWNAEVTQ